MDMALSYAIVMSMVSWSFSNALGVADPNTGFDTITVNYGTDAANLEGDHIRYLYGPGSILVAHGANEAITVRDLEAAVEGYKMLVKHALKSTK